MLILRNSEHRSLHLASALCKTDGEEIAAGLLPAAYTRVVCMSRMADVNSAKQ